LHRPGKPGPICGGGQHKPGAPGSLWGACALPPFGGQRAGPPKKTREAKKKMFLIKHFVANGVHLGHKVDE